MTDPVETWTVAIDADTTALQQELANATRYGRQFSASLTTAFTGLVVKGRSLGDTIDTLALSLSRIALGAAFKPLEQGLRPSVLVPALRRRPGVRQRRRHQRRPAGAVRLRRRDREPGRVPARRRPDRDRRRTWRRGDHAAGARTRWAAGRQGTRQRAAPRPIVFNVTTPDADSFRRSRDRRSRRCSRAPCRSASATCETGQRSHGFPRSALSGSTSRAGRWAALSGAPTSSCSAPAPRSAKPLGGLPAKLQRRLRRQTLDALHADDRLLRGAARPAARLSLARPGRLEIERAGQATPSNLDQVIGTGDGSHGDFPAGEDLWHRACALVARRSASRSPAPCAIAVAGVTRTPGTHFNVDAPPACDLSRRPDPRRRSSGDRRLRVRRARCASTPTSSRSTCRASATAPYRTFPSSRSGCEIALRGACRPISTAAPRRCAGAGG